MNTKVAIIGSGSVGATIAYTLATLDAASQIVLIDINTDKALGEALDIRQASPFMGNSNVIAGSYADARDADVVIITSGVARKPGQSRLDLAQTNVNIMKSIIPAITKAAPDAMYILVANPVDILTYQFCKYSGLSENQVLGTGTLLDTSRLCARIAEYYFINKTEVHAYVFGEHGDSSFVPWSIADISNIPVDEYPQVSPDINPIFPKLVHADVEDYVRKSGGKIIKRKGATFFAIACATSHLAQMILQNRQGDNCQCVSTMLHGEYGVSDVCLSMLTLIGRHEDGGVQRVIGRVPLKLTDDEVKQMQHSAECLKSVISSLNFN